MDYQDEDARRGRTSGLVGAIALVVAGAAIAAGSVWAGQQLGRSAAVGAMWIGLGFLFVALGLGLLYSCFRLGRLLRAAERELHATIDGVVPLIAKAGVSMDTVNVQLQKVDMMLDSAVDMTDSLDTSVRAVSLAISEPVKHVSSMFAGAAGTVGGLRDRMSWFDEEERDDDADSRSEAQTSGESSPSAGADGE